MEIAIFVVVITGVACLSFIAGLHQGVIKETRQVKEFYSRVEGIIDASDKMPKVYRTAYREGVTDAATAYYEVATDNHEYKIEVEEDLGW